MRGLFVTFEGIEGSGKSTQLALAGRALKRRRTPFLMTREPGGTRVGAELRRLVLHSRRRLDPATELLLIFADRRQHLVETIEPALSRGAVVLCDRYTDASRAYQGAGRRLGEDAVDELHRRFCGREPDRTYLFDCPVTLALGRLAGRRSAPDKIEREALAFHRRVRQAYLARAGREPQRFLVLDTRRSEEQVFGVLMADLTALLERAGVK